MANPLIEIRKGIQALELEKGHTQSDFYREYTQFLIRKLENISIIDSENKAVVDIPIFYANPERAIAKIKEDRNLVLPVISVGISDIEDDIGRRRYNMNVVVETAWNKTAQRATRVVSVAPKAVNLSFMVNLWAKYLEDLNQITEKIQLMFNPSLEFRTKFSDYIQGFITQVADNSVTVAPDRQDRVLKRTIQVSVEAYIPNQKYLYTNTGRIEKLNSDIIIEPFLELSGSATTAQTVTDQIRQST